MARLGRFWQVWLTVALLAVSPATPAAAAPGTVEAVEAGGLLRLADGRVLRLAAVAPPPGAETAWPAAVAALAVGQVVRPRPLPAPFTDRHGRLVAQVERAADGLWLQAALVAAGAAVVRPLPGEAAACTALLAAEAQARAAGRGPWSTGLWPLSPETAADALGRFAVVAGRVVAVAEVGGTTYLNFGADWRRDFTVALDRATARAVARAGHPPAALAGRLVRVRGWLRRYNGPFMDLDDACALEVLPPLPSAAPGG